jgi:hypothetical protein
VDDFDARKLKRRNLIVYLRVYDRATDSLLGHLVDITREGLMLLSEDPIEIGVVFQLRIDLGESRRLPRYLELEARSKWSGTDVNPRFIDTGFELEEPTAETLRSIDRMVADLGFPV